MNPAPNPTSKKAPTMTHDFTTISGVQAAIDTLPELMAQKGVVQPNAKFELTSNSNMFVWLRGSDEGIKIDDYNYKLVSGKDVGEIFQKCLNHINAMPDPVNLRLEAYTRRLAKATDKAREDGVDEKYIAPVSGAIQAMTDNLLTSDGVAPQVQS